MRSKLKPSETVKETFRQHWIVLWRPVSSLIFIILLIIFLSIYTEDFTYKYLKYSGIILLLVLLFLGRTILQRRFRLWVVTNNRVIYEWGVLSVNIKESPIEKINSVSFHQSIFGRILNFGDVIIQTAADLGDIKFDKIAYPAKFADTLSKMRDSIRK